jgi:hypothetical protein
LPLFAFFAWFAVKKPFSCPALQSGRIIHFRKEIDRMNRMNRIPKEQNDNVLVRALSCKSCSSCQNVFSWLRRAALGLFAPFRGKSIQISCHEQLASNRAACQARPIKPNQG